jgi:hypothetical protein
MLVRSLSFNSISQARPTNRVKMFQNWWFFSAEFVCQKKTRVTRGP